MRSAYIYGVRVYGADCASVLHAIHSDDDGCLHLDSPVAISQVIRDSICWHWGALAPGVNIYLYAMT